MALLLVVYRARNESKRKINNNMDCGKSTTAGKEKTYSALDSLNDFPITVQRITEQLCHLCTCPALSRLNLTNRECCDVGHRNQFHITLAGQTRGLKFTDQVTKTIFPSSKVLSIQEDSQLTSIVFESNVVWRRPNESSSGRLKDNGKKSVLAFNSSLAVEPMLSKAHRGAVRKRRMEVTGRDTIPC